MHAYMCILGYVLDIQASVLLFFLELWLLKAKKTWSFLWSRMMFSNQREQPRSWCRHSKGSWHLFYPRQSWRDRAYSWFTGSEMGSRQGSFWPYSTMTLGCPVTPSYISCYVNSQRILSLLRTHSLTSGIKELGCCELLFKGYIKGLCSGL